MMFRKGPALASIRQIPALARALKVDSPRLVQLARRSCQPEILQTIDATMGFAVTSREAEIIRALPELTDDSDPRLADPEQRAKLREFADRLTR